MPFRKRSSSDDRNYRPYWYVQLRLPAFGDTGTLSTRTSSKRKAERYEDLLRWLDDNEHWEILEGLRPEGRGQSGKVTLPEVYRARRENRIREMKRKLTDPLLKDAIAAAGKNISYNNHLVGLRHVLALAPEKARLSWATKPRHINGMIAQLRAKGLEDNSIRNSVWGGLSKLFQHHYGKSHAADILAEAERPSRDDRRDVHLTPQDIYDLISKCEWEMRMYLVLLLSLGIDKGPTLRLRVRDVDLDRWTIYIRDTKNENRPRTIDCPPAAVLALQLLCEGKNQNDRIIELSRGQVNYRWRLAREACEMEGVREKDLRHTFAVHYLHGGGNVAALQHRLGHKRGTQSLDYARHEAKGVADMQAAAEKMGLRLPDELREQLPDRSVKKQTEHEIPAWWYEPEKGPQGPSRYQKRGTAGWSREKHAEWMREYRKRRGREDDDSATGS